MAALPGLRDDRRPVLFAAGDVVQLDRVAYARLSRGDSALAEMAARRLPKILGQVTEADGNTVEVIWETGRLGIYAYPQAKTALSYTTTEVLILANDD